MEGECSDFQIEVKGGKFHYSERMECGMMEVHKLTVQTRYSEEKLDDSNERKRRRKKREERGVERKRQDTERALLDSESPDSSPSQTRKERDGFTYTSTLEQRMKFPSQPHVTAIEKAWSKLLEFMDVVNVENRLIEKGVLTLPERERLSAERDLQKRRSRLLHIIEKRDSGDFQHFLTALGEAKQPHLENNLKENYNPDLVHYGNSLESHVRTDLRAAQVQATTHWNPFALRERLKKAMESHVPTFTPDWSSVEFPHTLGNGSDFSYGKRYRPSLCP
ncbi:unnamed protein product, partial [Darwinula stevensoni]